MKVRLQPPEFEAVHFIYGVTQPKIVSEVLGYPARTDEQRKVLILQVSDTCEYVVCDGEVFLKRINGYFPQLEVITYDEFKKRYEPSNPEDKL